MRSRRQRYLYSVARVYFIPFRLVQRRYCPICGVAQRWVRKNRSASFFCSTICPTPKRRRVSKRGGKTRHCNHKSSLHLAATFLRRVGMFDCNHKSVCILPRRQDAKIRRLIVTAPAICILPRRFYAASGCLIVTTKAFKKSRKSLDAA